MQEWNEHCELNGLCRRQSLGIITSGISFMQSGKPRRTRVLKLGFTHPLPLKKIAQL